jgi:Flp pilus assembly protein TadG
MTGRRGARGDRGGEAGAVTVMVVIFAAVLVLLAGLVSDGGRVLAAKRRAINIAEQAARAGAQQLDVASVRGGGPDQLDPPAARAAAMAYLGQAGYAGAAHVYGDTVDVDVGWSQPLLILHIAGVGTPGGTVNAAARTVHGVTQEEP